MEYLKNCKSIRLHKLYCKKKLALKNGEKLMINLEERIAQGKN